MYITKPNARTILNAYLYKPEESGAIKRAALVYEGKAVICPTKQCALCSLKSIDVCMKLNPVQLLNVQFECVYRIDNNAAQCKKESTV